MCIEGRDTQSSPLNVSSLRLFGNVKRKNEDILRVLQLFAVLCHVLTRGIRFDYLLHVDFSRRSIASCSSFFSSSFLRADKSTFDQVSTRITRPQDATSIDQVAGDRPTQKSCSSNEWNPPPGILQRALLPCVKVR